MNAAPNDRAVLLLQRASELLLECRAVAQHLSAGAGVVIRKRANT